MAATISGAIKAYLEEEVKPGVTVYRDGAPVIMRDGKRVDMPPPYIVIQEGIGVSAGLSGDYGDPDAHRHSREIVQVDLYQQAREQLSATRTRSTEDPVLIRTLRHALTTVRIQDYAPTLTYGMRVDSEQRWPISDNLARYTYTVHVDRED